MMLISGTANTLLMKFMVMQKVPTGPTALSTGFDHPYFQSLLMMIGEFLCLIAYRFTQKPQDSCKVHDAPTHIFLVASCLDWTATTLVNMAYVVIAASVVQMTRGAIVIFTCLISVVFLGRRQHRYHIVGVMLVFLGITLVSLSTFMNPEQADAQRTSSASKIFGIGLCIGAQVFQASMLVYEEKIMSQYPVPPLQVVGMEGACGMAVGVILLSCLNMQGIESTPAALYQMSHSAPLLFAVIASIFSIAIFNFSGVTVTKQASAVARSTIDVSRTIIIWAIELTLGWNSFSFYELAGFFVLALGTLLYNRLIVVQCLEPPKEASPIQPNACELAT
jgi:drug/metabolite transporter (DMT)-like permease